MYIHEEASLTNANPLFLSTSKNEMNLNLGLITHLLTDIKWPRNVDCKVKLCTSVGENFSSWKGFILHPDIKGSGLGTSLNDPLPCLGPLKSGDKGLSSVKRHAFSTYTQSPNCNMSMHIETILAVVVVGVCVCVCLLLFVYFRLILIN